MLELLINTILFFNISGDKIQEKIENIVKIEKNKIIKKQKEEWNKNHIKTPKIVRGVYYTASAISYEKKFNNLVQIAKNTKINTVVIDIKEVEGYVNFKLDNSKFGKIKPETNNKIKNIKKIIEILHKNKIYVIGRIVVFKDNLLTTKRPDLAYKWTYDKKKIWADYAGNKYLDAGNKEVWDYNLEIASQAYKLGFDEINFDYVRFPSDGDISKIYTPFSDEILKKDKINGKIKIINNFGKYITSRLKKKHSKIVLSADVFGLVTNGDLNIIGQSLEGFLENFDYVCPMTYPSHYGRGFLGFRYPDNHPYEVISDALKNSYNKIEKYNLNKNNKNKLDKKQIRLWLQGFSCTWCKGSTPYYDNKFKLQTKAIEDNKASGFIVWSANSNYYESWYK